MANIDVEMGQFPIKTTMANSDYVVISLADGSQGQIKVSDIAPIVAAINVQSNTDLCSGGVYESVDLGLPSGTLWARYNVGATSETDYGDLFAWGVTDPYRLNGTTPIDNTSNYASSYANKIQHDLYPNEDAATVKWGKGWKMPTKAQFDELYNNTTYTWTTIGGVNGGKFTASNGNYIFFPAAGDVYGGSLHGRGSYGDYWSRSFNSSSNAWRLDCDSSERSVDARGRNLGFSVRAVRG